MFWQSKPKGSDWHDPERACVLLNDIPGMQGRAYKNWDDSRPKEYGCSTPYKVLGPEPLANNLAYYVTGDQNSVKELLLVLNVNVRHDADTGHAALAAAGGLLTQRALGADLSDEVVAALLAGQPGKWKAGKNRLVVIRDDWENGKGYEVKFIIR